MKRFLLVHYGEIGLKRANIDYFLEKLRVQLKKRLQAKFHLPVSIKHSLGRFMIPLPEEFDEEVYGETVTRIFGIKNFKFVYEGDLDLDILGPQIWEKLNLMLGEKLGKNDLSDADKPTSFRVKVKRSMTLPYRSFEAERLIGAFLIASGIKMKGKMKEPDLTVDIEFFNEHAYFSFQKYIGLGGLSPLSQSKFVSLLSTGIDSPVASFQMMRRGARIIFVHFHSYPYTDQRELNQAKDLVKILSSYQEDSKLYMIEFTKIQKTIATTLEIPAKYRVVLYRRMMLRIAEIIAKREHAKGLVTGDSLGQVASQTAENLFAIHDVTTIPLFQPLISFDKEDTVILAKKIGTYDLSILPCKDTCAMFMPQHPELKANPIDAAKYEKSLQVNELIEEALIKAEIFNFA